MKILKEAKTVYVRAEMVKCPHRDANVEGWHSDPRGIETECDECGQSFKVSTTADIRMT